jgi:hypothetical protein
MSLVYESDLNASNKTGIRGTSGFDTIVSRSTQTYPGAQDIRAGLPMLGSGADGRLRAGPDLGGWALVASVHAPNRSGQPGSARDRCACSTAYRGASVAELTNVAKRHTAIQWLAATALAASDWSWRTRRNARPRHAFQLGSPGPATVRANLFCRCQNGDPTLRPGSAQPTPSGDVAYVTVGYCHEALVIAGVDRNPLADDLQCGGGGPDTSVYREPLTGC